MSNAYEISGVLVGYGGDGARRVVATIEAASPKQAFAQFQRIVRYPWTHGANWQVKMVANKSGRMLGRVTAFRSAPVIQETKLSP